MRALLFGSLGLLPLTIAALAVSGCTSHADGSTAAAEPKPDSKPPITAKADPKPVEPKPVDPEPKPAQSPADVQVSVASVQLFEDCPDSGKKKKEAAAKQGSMAKPAAAPASRGPVSSRAARRKPGSGPLPQPCTQSNAQLSVSSTRAGAATFELIEVRLRLADGNKALGEVPFREPKQWAERRYDAWDGTVPAEGAVKASYSLGLPDWNAVEKAVGGSSFGPMYVLEFDIAIDGVAQTLESTPVPRERPRRVVT